MIASLSNYQYEHNTTMSRSPFPSVTFSNPLPFRGSYTPELAESQSLGSDFHFAPGDASAKNREWFTFTVSDVDHGCLSRLAGNVEKDKSCVARHWTREGGTQAVLSP